MGLAVYERRRHHVTATPARFRRHGFGGRPYFRALICRRGAVPIGVAVYLFMYSTFAGRPILYIEDIFVRPRDRRQGAGLALMRALARTALDTDCGRMEWSVLRWNRPAIDFYRRLGAEPHDAWLKMRMVPAGLKRLARPGVRVGRSNSTRARSAGRA